MERGKDLNVLLQYSEQAMMKGWLTTNQILICSFDFASCRVRAEYILMSCQKCLRQAPKSAATCTVLPSLF